MRRDVAGGKRGQGHRYQALGRKVRRPDPTRIHKGQPDATLTGYAGLADFAVFAREQGLDYELSQRFSALKTGRRVVYPMGSQLRLLVDANVTGEARVFGLEALSADPLVARLAGGFLPSLDTVYRDLERFDDVSLRSLEELMAEYGLGLPESVPQHVHLDVDTTVEPVFGAQEGALPGPNPRYHGRPSYHPLLGVVAETGMAIGAELRPGDRGFGERDVASVRRYVRRLRAHSPSVTLITFRMDAGGDCTALFSMLDAERCRFIVKLRGTTDLHSAVLAHDRWTVVERDADGKPTVQVATVPFHRAEWHRAGLGLRVIAVRRTDRDTGKQIRLWDGYDDTIQLFVTNDWLGDSFEIASEYDGRAEVEGIIAELKHAWGIGKIPSRTFHANHALFLLKVLTHNLFRAFSERRAPRIAYWRAPWLRRVLICRPGRLLRSGRRWTLRTAPQFCRLE